jgi:hypothetical protein
MRRMVLPILLLVVVAFPARAQFGDVTDTGPAEGEINAAEFNIDWPWVAAIAYAKDVGQTPQQYGRFIGELAAPGWTARTPTGFMLRMYRNYCEWEGLQFEVVDVSQDMISVRTNVPYESRIGDTGDPFGVTLQDYVAVHEAAYDAIAEHLNFELTREREGAWTVITVRVKS